MLQNNRRIINKIMGCSEKDAANYSMQIYVCKPKKLDFKKTGGGALIQDVNILIKIHITQQCFFGNKM